MGVFGCVGAMRYHFCAVLARCDCAVVLSGSAAALLTPAAALLDEKVGKVEIVEKVEQLRKSFMEAAAVAAR